MKQIKIKTWIAWALILFFLGILTDYLFLHILFRSSTVPTTQEEAKTTPKALSTDSSFLSNKNEEPAVEDANINDTFLEELQKCAPEIAAQAVATPEALVEFLRKSVGVAKEDISIENYHLTTPDGSKRRVHLVVADNTNSTDKKELRYFKLDAEGYPERLETPVGATLESLLALGTVTRHEAKSQLELKDGSSVTLEMHDNRVFEFQFNNHGKTLSCRFKECQCL